MKDSNIENFIDALPVARQAILSALHRVILKEDETVTPVIEPMMGKEMIIYKAKGMMKYALASGKAYMSLHCLPIYMNKSLFDRYVALLPDASFQKGCINFTSADEVPVSIIRDLITDCAPVDLVQVREDMLRERKLQAKTKKK